MTNDRKANANTHRDRTMSKARYELELIERWNALDPVDRKKEWAVMGEKDRKIVRMVR